MIHIMRNMVFLDVVTTGHRTATDRVLQIGALRVEPNGEMYSFEVLVQHPGVEITPEILAATCTEEEDWEYAFPWEEAAEDTISWLKGCHLAGFNILAFDLPILAEEFARVGIDFPSPDIHVIDPSVIFNLYHPRTLQAAMAMYAHESPVVDQGAMQGALAAMKILEGQIKAHDDLPRSIPELARFCAKGRNMADAMRLFYYDPSGALMYGFGKYKDQPVEKDERTKSYLHYMLQRDFPLSTKRFITRYLNNQQPQKAD